MYQLLWVIRPTSERTWLCRSAAILFLSSQPTGSAQLPFNLNATRSVLSLPSSHGRSGFKVLGSDWVVLRHWLCSSSLWPTEWSSESVTLCWGKSQCSVLPCQFDSPPEKIAQLGAWVLTFPYFPFCFCYQATLICVQMRFFIPAISAHTWKLSRTLFSWVPSQFKRHGL